MVNAFLLVVFLLSTQLLQAAGDNVLGLSSSLTPSSPPLSSPSSAFMLSFRPSSSSPFSSFSSASLYLAISFAVSPNSHPAWVANRHTAVSASATLTLSNSGDLRLSDPSISSNIIWASGTSGLDVVRAELLDTGNLVLLNSSDGYVWQSFQHPTDTLLPGQPFTAKSQLISGKRSDGFSTGRYTLTFKVTGVLELSYTQYVANSVFPQDYWDWGTSFSVHGTQALSVFMQFDQLGNISLYGSPSSIESTFISNDYGSRLIRRVTLDVDGNLRMYSWDQASAQWNSVWLAFTDVCSRVKQLCGSYGVCLYEPQPTCVCPPGFSVLDSTDLSGGCRPNHQIVGCSSTKYVELEDIDFPYNDYHDFISSSEEECKNQCSDSCSCVAAVYWQTGDGHCWLKQQVQNGYSPGSQQHRVFLKISDSDPFVSSPIVDTATKWSTQSLSQ